MIATDDILSFFSGPEGRPIKRRELARELGVREREYPAFRTLIRELIKSGRLVKLKRGRLAPPDPLNLVLGIVCFFQLTFVMYDIRIKSINNFLCQQNQHSVFIKLVFTGYLPTSI